jgi:hypothetical protein
MPGIICRPDFVRHSSYTVATSPVASASSISLIFVSSFAIRAPYTMLALLFASS